MAIKKVTASITSCFDGGNIDVVSCADNEFQLRIRKDPYTEGTDKKHHSQWFYFRASNLEVSEQVRFRIVNAGECSYEEGWHGYWACVSYDRDKWFRAPTTYSSETGELVVTLCPEKTSVWVAYFAPFSYERHMKLIARCAQSPLAHVLSLGQSLEGRELDCVVVGSGDLQVWVTARQHPGETQAEYFAEGLLHRLLDPDDALSRKLQALCTFRIVPNMCPDGSVRGHLRTNACGANLNREWSPTGDYDAPTIERSPEVFYVRRAMHAHGVDIFFDVHADEELPHNFFAGSQGTSTWTTRHARLLQILAEAYNRANPDFGSLEFNYSNDNVGEASLTMANDYVGEYFPRSLSVTLEQPFKDCFCNPEARSGYSPARCRRLGASALDAFAAVVPLMRLEELPEFDPTELPAWVLPGYKCPVHEEVTWARTDNISN
eukprot:TRINITY_DN64261_c0_g1_i1.p1 TRINITY_DN64261_c0_g1~~TRINITY_DN64261_c0_g1_i1.p1  ORF type:complete len:434 (+),score=68.88 TRINITY_DN64261_c0_g1_i1:97-1398(+)